MATNKLHRDNLEIEFAKIISRGEIGDGDVLESLKTYVVNRISNIVESKVSWTDFKTFWPPRLLSAFRDDRFLCFLGAGLSIPSGLPSWNMLLTNYLKLDERFTQDQDLQYDPLTLAEIASNYMGSENLQNILRNEYKRNIYPVTNHYLTALLRAPIYITTNYDELFEKAWKIVNPNIHLAVITNDFDLATHHLLQNHISNPVPDTSYLFKIHGCVTRDSEQLILTRKDYRLHYRSNKNFFDQIRALLEIYHVLFIGFSHRDVEVSRLVDDAIYRYEANPGSKQPNFYSLQFDMLSHTPEIFAAKGIVAVEPPIVTFTVDYRSIALNTALAELLLADSYNLSSKVSLEDVLEKAKTVLESELLKGLDSIEIYKASAFNSIKISGDYGWMPSLVTDLGDLANEGVYLCDDQGIVLNHEVPLARYPKASRAINFPLSVRPYFRQANTFRDPFISDSFKSQFNKNSTFTLCLPLIENESFKGLLFAACQIGNWKLPIDEAGKIWSKGLSFLLVDSNGNCLLPPNKEFGLSRDGYEFNKLLLLSKKDKVISRVIENVVPINKDDDIINISNSVKYYTLITELRKTRWKIGIATPILLDT